MTYDPWPPLTGWSAFKLNFALRLRELRWRILSAVCSLVGHARETYKNGTYVDARGRLRDKHYARCTRCGCDGPGVYSLTLHGRMFIRWHEIRNQFRHWRRTDCLDCGRPEIRFGRPAGDHRNCDQIPF